MTGSAPPGVQLIGEKVRLREFRADDLDDSDAILGDDRVTRWLSFDSRTREQQADVLTGALERAKHTPCIEYYLAVTTHTEDRLIGFVRLGLSGLKAAKLGFAIAAPRWATGTPSTPPASSSATGSPHSGSTASPQPSDPITPPPSRSSPSSPSLRRADYAITSSPTARGATPSCTPYSPTNGNQPLPANYGAENDRLLDVQ